jgi:hypothetical protein
VGLEIETYAGLKKRQIIERKHGWVPPDRTENINLERKTFG